MPKIRFILSKQPDPALDEAAIIKRLKGFYTGLRDKRQSAEGIPKEERAAYNELWHYPQNELPKPLEVRIRRWAQKIHRHHFDGMVRPSHVCPQRVPDDTCDTYP